MALRYHVPCAAALQPKPNSLLVIKLVISCTPPEEDSILKKGLFQTTGLSIGFYLELQLVS